MKLYIWDDLMDIYENGCHNGGALLICTDGDPLETWAKYATDKETEYDGKKLADAQIGEPDMIIDMLPTATRFILVHGQRGCC